MTLSASNQSSWAEGEVIGGYTITSCLECGENPRLYLVKHNPLGNAHRARAFDAQDEGDRARVRAEAQARSRLSHPHLVGVRDIFEHGEALVVVSEQLRGPTLDSLIEEQGKFDEESATALILQVLSGLSVAHRRNLYFDELTLSDVIVELDEQTLQVSLDGFGAPDKTNEALTQDSIAQQRDIHRAAHLLYTLLTGAPYSPDATPLRAQLPTLSLGLERALTHALAEDLQDGFTSAEELTSALRSDSILSAAPSTRSQRAPRWTIALVAAVALISSALLLLIDTGEEEAGPAKDSNYLVDRIEEAPPTLNRGEEESLIDQTLPSPSAQAPLPLAHLPGVHQAPALVNIVLSCSLERAYASPEIIGHLESLEARYGENLGVAFLVVDKSGSSRAYAALAAHAQGGFLDYASALTNQPELTDEAALVDLARKLRLNPERFKADLADYGPKALVHHQEIAAFHSIEGPGVALINGQPLRQQGPPQVLRLEELTEAIDRELDGVQTSLVEGVPPEEVAHTHTVRSWRDRPRPLEPLLSPLQDTRFRLPLEGAPSLGANNAPISVVAYLDLSTPQGLAARSELYEAYKRHPDSLRLTFVLAPARACQQSFDTSVALLSSHAAGRFWADLDLLQSDAELPHPSSAAAELFRVRLVAQGETYRALGGVDAPLIFVNGRRVAHGDNLWPTIQDERRLVDLLLAAGVDAASVQSYFRAALIDLPAPEPTPEAHFFLANWHSLPRIGPVDAPVVVFLRLSFQDPDWAQSLISLIALVDEFGDAIALCLVPLLTEEDETTLAAFSIFWGQEQNNLRDHLGALERLALTLPPVGNPRASQALIESALSVDPIRLEELRPSITLASYQWRSQDPTQRVAIAWREGLRFSAWMMPGGLAMEPYWARVREALAKP